MRMFPCPQIKNITQSFLKCNIIYFLRTITPPDKVLRQMLGVFAEFERSIIRARRAPERKGVRPGPRHPPGERTGDGLSVGGDRLRSPVMSDPGRTGHRTANRAGFSRVPGGYRFCRERPRSRPLYRSSGRCPLSQRPASPKTTASEVGVQHPRKGGMARAAPTAILGKP